MVGAFGASRLIISVANFFDFDKNLFELNELIDYAEGF